MVPASFNVRPDVHPITLGPHPLPGPPGGVDARCQLTSRTTLRAPLRVAVQAVAQPALAPPGDVHPAGRDIPIQVGQACLQMLQPRPLHGELPPER